MALVALSVFFDPSQLDVASVTPSDLLRQLMTEKARLLPGSTLRL
jgi:hypothetical protein